MIFSLDGLTRVIYSLLTMTTPNEITAPLNVGNGFFYVVEFSATGGVKYTRQAGFEETHGDELIGEFTTQKHVDHVGLLKLSRKAINAAYLVMERWASATPIGYFVSSENAPKLEAELAKVAEDARGLNAIAEQFGSKRRVRIGAYRVQVKEDDSAVAVRLAQTVRERLAELGENLRAGDLNAYATTWKRAKNLPRLATGIQAESIVFALEAAKEARAEVARLIREGTPIDKAGQSVNLDALESAIHLFTDSVNGSLATVTDEAIA